MVRACETCLFHENIHCKHLRLSPCVARSEPARPLRRPAGCRGNAGSALPPPATPAGCGPWNETPPPDSGRHRSVGDHAHSFTGRATAAGVLRYLTQRLLQARLLGHRQVAHRLPAGAQLLHLHFDPGRVVVAALDQLPGGALEGLNADRPLPQLLLENLPEANQCQQTGRG